MNRVEILNLRNEALDPNAEGPPDIGGDWIVLSLDEFFRFANLVAAAEREACAKVCEENMGAWMQTNYNVACGDCAHDILARGEK